MIKQCTAILMVLLAALFTFAAKGEDAGKIKTQGPAIKKNNMLSASQQEELIKVKEEAGLILENILMAMNKNNYKNYIRDFNPAMRSAYPEEVFKKNTKHLKSKIGKYVSGKPSKIGKLNQHYVVYYAVTFSKTSDPVVVRLVLERSENILKVVFLSFNSPALSDDQTKQKEEDK